MRRVIFSLLIGCIWLLVSMFLIYLKYHTGDVLPWQSGYVFWPGKLIAIEIAVVRNCGEFFGGECWRDILVVVTAQFWIAALSNLVFYSGLAYLLLSVLAKVKRKP
jgi:hypothetical protein